MSTNTPGIGDSAARGPRFALRVSLISALLVASHLCAARTVAAAGGVVPAATPSPTPTPDPTTDDPSPAPLTERERAMLELIKGLQDRVSKLEAQAAGAAEARAANAPAPKGTEILPPEGAAEPPAPSSPGKAARAAQETDDKKFGDYTPNLGFKLADTEYGDINVSIYTYVRYLNQLGLDPTYTDAFGNTKDVQQRQDAQLLKLQIKFLGWMLTPKLRYFLYAWTTNANQGQGAQTVLAGNLQYTFNKYFTLGGGIRSLPGTRSVEGNFPFWPNVDSRHIADEFMRPSYTSGFWLMGNLHKRVKYTAMVGNNMSTLGVPASRLDNGLNTFSGALVWFPTGNFEDGFSGQGWGDFEHHDKFSTRLAFHFSRSDENKESQPGSDTFENTQLRLSDGTVIFTSDLFGPGVTITDARWRMTTVDGGFKYKGYSLEGEYYWRWLDNFKFLDVVTPLQLGQVPGRIFDHAFQIQGTAMLVPKKLQAYAGHSRVFGDYGRPWDFRAGANFFPFKSKVVRWNNEALYLRRSPVGYTSVPYAVGGNGFVFHSSFELAF
ncbi:MAG TPA: hypothetical protein VNZ44_19995 [Pyrinomonadaceae bacterium]|nr:hypothetical protein [Pyrinomonadaceae bacterium]